jgi:hypothetical protein
VSSHSLTELLQERHKGRLPLADARRRGSEVRSPSAPGTAPSPST